MRTSEEKTLPRKMGHSHCRVIKFLAICISLLLFNYGVTADALSDNYEQFCERGVKGFQLNYVALDAEDPNAVFIANLLEKSTKEWMAAAEEFVSLPTRSLWSDVNLMMTAEEFVSPSTEEEKDAGFGEKFLKKAMKNWLHLTETLKLSNMFACHIPADRKLGILVSQNPDKQNLFRVEYPRTLIHVQGFTKQYLLSFNDVTSFVEKVSDDHYKFIGQIDEEYQIQLIPIDGNGKLQEPFNIFVNYLYGEALYSLSEERILEARSSVDAIQTSFKDSQEKEVKVNLSELSMLMSEVEQLMFFSIGNISAVGDKKVVSITNWKNQENVQKKEQLNSVQEQEKAIVKIKNTIDEVSVAFYDFGEMQDNVELKFNKIAFDFENIENEKWISQWHINNILFKNDDLKAEIASFNWDISLPEAGIRTFQDITSFDLRSFIEGDVENIFQEGTESIFSWDSFQLSIAAILLGEGNDYDFSTEAFSYQVNFQKNAINWLLNIKNFLIKGKEKSDLSVFERILEIIFPFDGKNESQVLFMQDEEGNTLYNVIDDYQFKGNWKTPLFSGEYEASVKRVPFLGTDSDTNSVEEKTVAEINIKLYGLDESIREISSNMLDIVLFLEVVKGIGELQTENGESFYYYRIMLEGDTLTINGMPI